eukprot:TRINITY_DN8412_c0_g1_i2.p1 TRINITY_DN8412_c0_g1~~TRINITY_DN8412_c0_g1_i2.p1  ORF type:complete len:391 (-),score=49.99 TRINITY_DN8412_c0_g1_i2:150-1202(-)
MPGTLQDPFYPEIEPYESGHLAVGDGHEVYYEICGAREGKPVLFLHGGPGAGCSVTQRRYFDPTFYKVVLFDQRGCGRSEPNASKDLQASLRNNNTQSLVEDCEAVKKHVGVTTPWYMVYGGSWGTTLGIAYAQAYPESVDRLFLRGVFTGEQDDINHAFNGGMEDHHPEAWEAFAKHITETASDQAEAERESKHILAGYYKRLTSGDAEKAAAAAREFVRYEITVVKNDTPKEMIDGYLSNPLKLIPFATFECHFMLNHLFLRECQLQDDCVKFRKSMKVRIVHGRNDFICRPSGAWRIAKRMKAVGLEDVKVNFVNGWGHHDTEAGVGAAIVQGTDELRGMNDDLSAQ